MIQEPLPKEYVELEQAELDDRIRSAKSRLGERLVILGHHYQRDEIIRHADFTGDSFKLAKNAAAHAEAEYIVFCGVHFMAESADILTPDEQTVILPNLAAGCSMADMASLFQVRACWRQLERAIGDKPAIPVTYINSTASLKAFVGERGGTVCTSSNAQKAVTWALSKGDKVLFFPDQHLGRNTGVALGFDPEHDMCVWDPFKPLGGNDVATLKSAKFILWKGHCSVHQRFTVEQITVARAKYSAVRVIVHPECPLEVVQAADESGSTESIVSAIDGAPAGSIWGVGTEINLVNRLSKRHPEQTVFCLDPQVCPCSTMYRIHPSYLCWCLERVVEGHAVNVICVEPEVKLHALSALNRMLTVCA